MQKGALVEKDPLHSPEVLPVCPAQQSPRHVPPPPPLFSPRLAILISFDANGLISANKNVSLHTGGLMTSPPSGKAGRRPSLDERGGFVLMAAPADVGLNGAGRSRPRRGAEFTHGSAGEGVAAPSFFITT